jgi:hypothetical protein
MERLVTVRIGPLDDQRDAASALDPAGGHVRHGYGAGVRQIGIVVVIHGRALQMIADHGANSSTLTDAAIDRLHPESTTTDDASSRTTRRSGSSNGRRSSCRSAWKAGLSTGRSIQARRTRA